MDLYLPRGRRGLQRALYEQLRAAIAEGRVRPGEPLPPSRELARALGVSRHTVTTAYGFLVAEGFFEGHAGGGTRVAAAPLARAQPAPPRSWPSAMPPPPRDDGPRPLELGVPDAALFPHDEWRRQVARALRRRDLAAATYGDPAGDPALRAAIAAFVQRSRGVRATPAEVVVSAGAQQAFDLVLAALLRPGDTVAVEDPGYPPFRRLAAARGARVVAVPVDEEGLVVAALPARARLVYVTPSHQFPLGPVLSLQRRRALLDWARSADAAVLEDDYDSEFRFAARPLEPLQRLDDTGRVLYVGSFSKVLSPSLRLGFVVAPAALAPVLAERRALCDGHSPLFLQRALAGLIADGGLDRHLRRARKAYHERHQRLCDWARAQRWGRLVASEAGLHLALALDGGAADEAALVAAARAVGVAVESLGAYAADPTRARWHGLALGYGGADPATLARLLPRLARAARRALR
jgi:GntR family transcriptional regulator/MocR family aminotransferase